MRFFKIPPIICETNGETIVLIRLDADTMTGRMEYFTGQRDGHVEVFVGSEAEEVPF